MKRKTKENAILEALLAGEKLTVKTCMEKCGTYKVGTRLIEFERQYHFAAVRKMVSSKSRYGGVDRYIEYSLKRSDITKIKRKLKCL